MIDPKRIMNGSHGSLWVDNELWAETENFDSVVNIDYESVNIAGNLGTPRKQVGWNGTGNLTVHKVNSRVSKMMAQRVKTGQTPRLKFVGKLADPDAFGAERVAFYDVTLDSFTLRKFEQKTNMKIEIPFQFSDYD